LREREGTAERKPAPAEASDEPAADVAVDVSQGDTKPAAMSMAANG
jgi:hypothetical protein